MNKIEIKCIKKLTTLQFSSKLKDNIDQINLDGYWIATNFETKQHGAFFALEDLNKYTRLVREYNKKNPIT